jgi:hypothetical protein
MAKRESAVWGGDNPHDKLMLPEGAAIKHLDGDLLHYSFNTPEEYKKQQEKFAEISAMSYYRRGIKASTTDLFFSPLIKFFKDYFFNLGFLEGADGWNICTTATRATYLKYKKLRELWSAK